MDVAPRHRYSILRSLGCDLCTNIHNDGNYVEDAGSNTREDRADNTSAAVSFYCTRLFDSSIRAGVEADTSRRTYRTTVGYDSKNSANERQKRSPTSGWFGGRVAGFAFFMEEPYFAVLVYIRALPLCTPALQVCRTLCLSWGRILGLRDPCALNVSQNSVNHLWPSPRPFTSSSVHTTRAFAADGETGPSPAGLSSPSRQ